MGAPEVIDFAVPEIKTSAMKHTALYPILFLCFLLCQSPAAFAQIRTTVQIDGLPKVLLKNSYTIVVRAIEVETAKVASAVNFRKASGFVLLSAAPARVFVDYVDNRKKTLYGVSKLIRPVAGKRNKVIIKLAKKLSPGGLSRKAPRLAALSLPAGARVGIPSSAFTASGPGMGPHIAAGEADMLITDLVQAPCYKNAFRNGDDFQDGEKFVIREMDPDKLAALQQEIDRSQTPAFDPATRMTNRWQAPTVLVNGQVVSNGATITITVNVTDAAGNSIFTESASGPASKRLDVHDQVADKLKKKFCEEQDVTISQKSCQAASCRCCDLENPGCVGLWWVEKWSGTASGPVGSVFNVNIIANPDYGTLSCGGWTEEVVSNLRGCKRTSAGQPESINFEASRNLYPPGFPIHCSCPTPEPTDSVFLAEILTPENKYKADEQSLKCPQVQ